MLDDSNLGVVPLWIKFSDVSAIEENLALLRVVPSLNQRDQRGFTAARGTAEGNNTVLLVVKFERNALEDLLVLAGVSEMNISDLEGAVDFAIDFVAALTWNGSLLGHELMESIGSSKEGS